MLKDKEKKTVKFQCTMDVNTDRIIGEIVEIGILGTTKSEVATGIIRNWLWENQEQLQANGISFNS